MSRGVEVRRLTDPVELVFCSVPPMKTIKGSIMKGYRPLVGKHRSQRRFGEEWLAYAGKLGAGGCGGERGSWISVARPLHIALPDAPAAEKPGQGC